MQTENSHRRLFVFIQGAQPKFWLKIKALVAKVDTVVEGFQDCCTTLNGKIDVRDIKS